VIELARRHWFELAGVAAAESAADLPYYRDWVGRAAGALQVPGRDGNYF